MFRKWGDRAWIGYLIIALVLWGGIFLARWLLPLGS
jgi:hypothetical protein